MSSQVLCNNCHFALDPNVISASTVNYCPSCRRPVNLQTVGQRPSAGPALDTLEQWCHEAFGLDVLGVNLRKAVNLGIQSPGKYLTSS